MVLILQHDDVYMWEQDATRFLQGIPIDRIVFDVTNFLTNTISVPFVAFFFIIAGVLLSLGRRLEAGLLLLTFPLHVLAQSPKVLVDRPRPSAAFPSIEGVGGLQSFPSGHAEYVITFYGFLAIVILSYFDRRWQRYTVILVWLLLAFIGRND